MPNILRIEGRKSPIINTGLNIEAGLFLSAEYQDRMYDLRTVVAAGIKDEISLAVLRFDPEDGKYRKGGLNHVVLMTTFGGIYRATGVSRISKVNSKESKFYKLGDDLEIVVCSEAEKAIESIKDLAYEIERAVAGRDMPLDYLGLGAGSN